MAKPSSTFEWATNTNYVTGPDAGTPTKVEPSAGEVDDGFVRNTAAVAQHMNWALGQVQGWTDYLSDLHNETEFLNKTYTWTGVQALGGSVETTYSAARSRVININPQACFGVWDTSGNGGAGIDLLGGAYVRESTTLGTTVESTIAIPLVLPIGAVITGWAAVVTPASGGTKNAYVRLMKRSVDMTGAVLPPSPSAVGSIQGSSGTTRQAIGQTGLSETVAPGAIYTFYLDQGGVSSAGEIASLHGLQVYFNETRATGHY